MIRIDLHTHSEESPDGGLNEEDYYNAFKYSDLDLIAITDHGSVKFAKYMKNHQVIGSSIIVGAEVSTSDGDLLGLFLKSTPKPGLSASETAKQIQKQGGLVVVPHPGDSKRSSISLRTIQDMANQIDAIESFNGRRIKHGKTMEEIRSFAIGQSIPLIASSDAHNASGIGHTYTTIPSLPANATELKTLLKEQIETTHKRPPFSAFIAPKLNRLLKKLGL